jgi:hypothetical protein
VTETAQAAGGPRRRVAFVVVGLVALAVVGFSGKGFVVTALVERGLAERGVRCTRIAVDVAWDLSAVDVAQTTCRFGTGEREVEAGLPSGATIVIEGTRATHIRSPEITLALAGDGEREIQDLGGALLDGEVPEPLERALDGLARIAQQASSLPRIEVEALRLRRGTRTLDGYDFVLSSGEGRVDFTLASVAPPALGERRLEIAASIVSLEGHATSDRAEIRGRAELALELGPLGVTRSLGFTIAGEALGTAEARYTLTMEGGGRLAEIRDRITQMRERRAERLEHRQERVDAMADRVHELAERLRSGRDEEPGSGDAGVP